MIEKQKPELLQKVKDSLEAAEQLRLKQRFAFNLQQLLDRQENVLHNQEFVSNLMNALSTSGDLAETTIELLGQALVQTVASPDANIRERSIAILSIIGTLAMTEDNTAALSIVAVGYRTWLENETQVFSGIEHLYNEFAKLIECFLKRSDWQQALPCLEILRAIADIRTEKEKYLKILALRSLTRISTKHQLGYLVDSYLRSEEESKELQEILVSLEEPAARLLLNRLVVSKNRDDSLRLGNMLSEFGPTIKPLLSECLNANPPGEIARRILTIIGNIGDEQLFDLVEQTLGHLDERVQLEGIKTILKFDDASLQARLLRALDIVSDRMKLHILRLLINLKAQEAGFLTKITNLLRHREHFNDTIRKSLTMAAVACLKLLPAPASIDLLNELLADRASRSDDPQVRLAVNETLQVLKPQVRRLRRRKTGQNEVTFDMDPAARQLAHNNFRKIEAEIKLLLAKNLVKEAGNLLYDKGSEAAHRQDFVTAEMLLERLLSVDPMALDRAIELGQLIEKAKSDPHGSQFVNIWRKFQTILGDVAFQALQNLLDVYEFKPGETIIETGEMDATLYFINSGVINISCYVGSREVFLKRLQPGDVAGSEHFFSPSVWTVNLLAHSFVQLQALTIANYHHLCGRFPEFGEQFKKICQESGCIEQLISTSGEDRRVFPRFAARLPIDNLLFDLLGLNSKKKFRGELQDISHGGYSFVIHIATIENVRLLLGRRIVSSVSIDNTQLPLMQGIVVGIHNLDISTGKYCIHVKVDGSIPDESLALVGGDINRI